MGLPMVVVLLPAKSSATGCAVAASTISEPESPPALKVLEPTTTWSRYVTVNCFPELQPFWY